LIKSLSLNQWFVNDLNPFTNSFCDIFLFYAEGSLNDKKYSNAESHSVNATESAFANSSVT